MDASALALAQLKVRLSAGLSGAWWELGQLRHLACGDARGGKPLGYAAGPGAASPEFAFLALDLTPEAGGVAGERRRSLVVFRGGAVAVYDRSASDQQTEEQLNAFDFRDGVRLIDKPGAGFDSIDFAGAAGPGWTAAFYRERFSAQGAVSFAVDGNSPRLFVVTGLAPGAWELWRNGWLEDGRWEVPPQAGMLHWQGAGGSFFLRRGE